MYCCWWICCCFNGCWKPVWGFACTPRCQLRLLLRRRCVCGGFGFIGGSSCASTAKGQETRCLNWMMPTGLLRGFQDVVFKNHHQYWWLIIDVIWDLHHLKWWSITLQYFTWVLYKYMHGFISFLLKQGSWNQEGCRATRETVNWNVENSPSLGFGVPNVDWHWIFFWDFSKWRYYIKLYWLAKSIQRTVNHPFLSGKYFLFKPPNFFSITWWMFCQANCGFSSPGRCERNWPFSWQTSFFWDFILTEALLLFLLVATIQ